jgi:cytochrome d ubiquinol oxidase subunit II
MEFFNNIQVWQALWFVLIGAAIFLFLWLDGFDLGIGMTLPFLKNDQQRLAALNTIWPTWDGNELYGLIGGGAIFATFPVVFAALLSGLYPWVVLLLLGIMLRPIAFEAWNNEPGNKMGWAWLFACASLLIPFVAGVALGTTIAGMPINKDMVWDHGHGFWEALSPLSVLTGLAVVGLALLQGSAYLVKRTSGELQAQARKDLTPRTLFAGVALVLTLVAALVQVPELLGKPLALAGIVVGLVLILVGLAGVWLHRDDKSPDAAAYWFSSAIIAGTMVLIGGIQFPTMIRSTLDPNFSLTIFKDGVSNPLNSLVLIAGITVVALAITWVYSILVFRIFKGKVDHKTNVHY